MRRGSVKPVPVEGGILKVSGSSVASLPRRPDASYPECEVILAIDAETGAETSITFKYNPILNELRLSKTVHAVIKYSDYVSSAEQLIYSPAPESQASPFVQPVPGSGGLLVRYGVVWAFAPPDTLATYDVNALDILPNDGGATELEVYRITSPVIGNGTGGIREAAELPTSGAYTTPRILLC